MNGLTLRITLFILFCLSLAGLFVGVQYPTTCILPVSSIGTIVVGFFIALLEFAQIDHVV